MGRPHNVMVTLSLLGGPPGSGKSTLCARGADIARKRPHLAALDLEDSPDPWNVSPLGSPTREAVMFWFRDGVFRLGQEMLLSTQLHLLLGLGAWSYDDATSLATIGLQALVPDDATKLHVNVQRLKVLPPFGVYSRRRAERDAKRKDKMGQEEAHLAYASWLSVGAGLVPSVGQNRVYSALESLELINFK